jgi:hypothetical protein
MQISISLLSKNETLLGLMMDQGEYEKSKGVWIPFTRIRLGIVFLTLDTMWYHSIKK